MKGWSATPTDKMGEWHIEEGRTGISPDILLVCVESLLGLWDFLLTVQWHAIGYLVSLCLFSRRFYAVRQSTEEAEWDSPWSKRGPNGEITLFPGLKAVANHKHRVCLGQWVLHTIFWQGCGGSPPTRELMQISTGVQTHCFATWLHARRMCVCALP